MKTLGEAPTVKQVSANGKFLHAPEAQIEKKIWTAFLVGLHTARADNVAEDADVLESEMGVRLKAGFTVGMVERGVGEKPLTSSRQHRPLEAVKEQVSNLAGEGQTA